MTVGIIFCCDVVVKWDFAGWVTLEKRGNGLAIYPHRQLNPEARVQEEIRLKVASRSGRAKLYC